MNTLFVHKLPFIAARKMLVGMAVLASLASCNNDEDEPMAGGPVIANFGYGEGSEHSTEPVAYRGSDIHMEAEITAEVNVASISVDIHADGVEAGEGETEWHYEQTYTDEKYRVRNPTFHEHIDVPATAPLGEYHITLTVVDELGNTTEEEGHVAIMAGDTTGADMIALGEVAIDSTVARGSDFHIDFTASAVHGIHSVVVDVHGHDLTVGEGEEEWHLEETYTEGIHGQTEISFHEHIDVPATAPVGEYHLKVIITDEEGNVREHEAHLEVTAEAAA